MIYDDAILYEKYQTFINSSYPSFLKRLSLEHQAVRAKGCVIVDSSENEYIDCSAGYGLFNLGHNNPDLISGLSNQLHKNNLLTRPFISSIQVEAAEKLASVAPGDLTCSLLLNSGSEAVDCSLKLAQLHKPGGGILSAKNSFHGHTFGALGACGIERFRKPFASFFSSVDFFDFNDSQDIETKITNDTAAVLLEPIQHEAGIAVPNAEFLKTIRDLCDKNNCLLIFDEVKTGFGKTGHFFACEHFNIYPDILVIGKSMGGGLFPAGGIIAKKNLWRKASMNFAMSASSFGGNTLLCSIVSRVIDILSTSNLLDETARKGDFFLQQLSKAKTEFPDIIKEVGGIGLLLGIETKNTSVATGLSREMIKEGVLAFPAFGNNSILMIEPPLIIEDSQIIEVCRAFRKACSIISNS